jgi:hypothetical protein
MAVSNCELIDCNEVVSDLYTTATLTPAISSLVLGVSVVRLAEYPNTCFRAIKPVNPVALAEAYTITDVFSSSIQEDNCDECTSGIQLYILEDCLEVEPPIYSFTEALSGVLNKVINIEGYPGICWSVSVVVYEDQDTEIVTIATNDRDVPQIFDDCECCLPAPEPAPVKYTRVIPKPDRKFYQIKQSQCDITANIRFAEGYYRLFKHLKYGIDSQCDNINLDKLWIRKNLSDLAVINDPTACIITTPVTPVICPEPTGNPFIPPAPPVTYTFTVGEPGVGTGTLNCTQCLDGTTPGIFGLCPAFNMVLDYNILDTVDPLAVYVFNYDGGCVITLGSFITLGETEGFETYTMTSANIINAGIEPENPCASCIG